MTQPRISVVLPAHCTEARHGTSRLRLTLISLTRQTLDPGDYEVIVVDNASEPPIASLVSGWGLADRVRVVRREETGLGAGYNAGLAEARAPLILLGTDDELAAPEMLARHLEGHARAEPSVVFGHCTFLFHTELFHDVTIAEPAPKALDRAAARGETGWLPGAVACLGLADKPVTADDVMHAWDKLMALAGTTPQFDDIERTVASGRCHSLPGGWLAMRVGNHSLPVTVLREIGGFDETPDEHGGWYLDLELGIRLADAGLRFGYAPAAVSTNLTHPRGAGGMLGVVSGMAYVLSKHPRMDVTLSPSTSSATWASPSTRVCCGPPSAGGLRPWRRGRPVPRPDLPYPYQGAPPHARAQICPVHRSVRADAHSPRRDLGTHRPHP
ncbi:glycosyltransferase family 2 protein [Streptomyces sp. NPDC079020]|uniref:glycosyltransferase family 2 protein n=1 Tax=Streptomyces sp. NPDC079020 TaxID=3365722 RepID=UPI0037D96A63